MLPPIELGPAAQAGPGDLPLWADILVIAGFALILIIGAILVLYFHSLKHKHPKN